MRAEHRGAFADASRDEGRKMLLCKPDKCVTGTRERNWLGYRADPPWGSRKAIMGPESKPTHCVREGIRKAGQRVAKAEQQRLCHSVLQSLPRGPSKILWNTQCKRGLSSELRLCLGDVVLEKQPAVVEFGEDVGGLLNFAL